MQQGLETAGMNGLTAIGNLELDVIHWLSDAEFDFNFACILTHKLRDDRSNALAAVDRKVLHFLGFVASRPCSTLVLCGDFAPAGGHRVGELDTIADLG